MLKKILSLSLLLLLAALCSHAQTYTIGISGETVRFNNGIQSQKASFTYAINGTSSAVVTLSGCTVSDVCTILDTYTGGGTVTRTPSLSTAYDHFNVKASFSAGASVGVNASIVPSGAVQGKHVNTVNGQSGDVTVNGNSGGTVGPGTPGHFPCFATPTTVGDCAEAIIGGPVSGGAASFSMTAGPTSGCKSPALGQVNFCADGTNNSADISVNGAPYAPIPVTSVFNVLSYGAVGDGYHIAADTAGIKAAFAASAPTCGTVYFPGAHSYGFDSIAAAYTLTNFCGTIQGDGYSSTITSNSDINSMWNFITPHDLTIKNLHFQQTPAGFNNGTYPVGMDTGTNILIEHNYSNDGDTAWRIGNSTHVRMEGNSCSNFHGNCLFGPNNNDLHMVNTACFNNGDTCEEFSRWHFETSPTCREVTSTGMTSWNDGTGIIVDSCTDVSISNFTIYTPGGGMQGAIFIAQDQLTTTDHYPNRVQLSNGYVYGVGYSNGNINNGTGAPCINMKTVTNISEPYNVLFNNLHLEHCAGAGIFVNDPNFAVNLQADNIRIIDAGAGGTSVGDPQNVGINFIGGKTLKMSNIYIENAYGTSFQSISGGTNTSVELDNITSVNPNQRGTGSFVNSIHNRNTSGTFILNGANIIDTWPSANRSSIVSASTTAIQNATNINFSCTVSCSLPSFITVNASRNAGGDIHASAFGSSFTFESASCETSFAPTTLSGATTTTGLTCLPANAIIDAVAYRVTTTITTATSFTIGDSGSATRYCGTQSVLSAGATGVCTAAGYYLNPTTAKGVLITPSTTPGAGAIRLIVYYHTWAAPTS